VRQRYGEESEIFAVCGEARGGGSSDGREIVKKEVKPVDWEGVERDYRAGILTLRQISDAYGTSHVSVFNRAKKEGWDRDLAAKIAAKAEALLNKQNLNEKINDSLSERQIVESNAQVVAIVALAHRRDIKGLRDLAARYKDELEECEDDLQKRAAILKTLTDVQTRLIQTEREAYGMDRDRPADTGLSGESIATLRKLKSKLEASDGSDA